MDNRCYNVFLYVQSDRIVSIGIVTHQFEGTDAQKGESLKSLVSVDCNRAQHFPLSISVEWSRYQAMQRIGNHLAILEPVWLAINAPADPMMLITPVVDGYPTVQAVSGLGPLNLADINSQIGEPAGKEDYLQTYIKDGGFDIPRLLNDDYLEAIKLLFNQRKYVSGSKLLMSFIDTIAFVEYGDIQGNFQKWLKEYADMKRLGVSAEELWEYRNSVLHTSSLMSRKIRAGTINEIRPYFGAETFNLGPNTLNLWTLIHVIADAIQKWIETYNRSPAKIESFIERYDLTLSDARVAIISAESLTTGPGIGERQ